MRQATKNFRLALLLLFTLITALPSPAQGLAGSKVSANIVNASIGDTLKNVKVQNGSGRQGQRTVSGRVVDTEGLALAGATVLIPNSQTGVITDSDGRFSINVPAGTKTLDISFVGMKRVSLTLGRKSQYNVTMRDDSTLLDEVVATGYQTLSKERATGAYGLLKSSEIEKRHSTNFSTLLDGLIAGAQGTDDGRGGVSYQIRGTGTMIGDQTPLVVVDGFPLMDIGSSNANTNPALSALEKINPADVESVTVLKDAAAASIWGARSANGVIVITTKKGKKKKLEVEVSTQLAVGQKQKMSQVLDVANSEDMIKYQRMCFDRGWISTEYTGDNLDNLTQPITASEHLLYQGLVWGTISEDQMNSKLNELSKLSNHSQIKKYFYNNPLVYQTNASLSGGVGDWSTYASVLYQHDTGDFIGSRQNSFMVNWNNQYDFNKHISLTVDLAMQHENAHQSQISESDLCYLSPYEMMFNSDGSYASHIYNYNPYVLNSLDWSGYTYQDMNYNMLQEARTRTQRTVNTSYRAQVGLKINIIEGLTFNSKFQYEQNRYKRRSYSSEESFRARYTVNQFTEGDYDGNIVEGAQSVLPKGGILQPSDGKKTGIVFRNDLSFDRTFGGRHSISAVVGNEVSNYRSSLYSRPYLYGCSSSDGTGGRTMDSGYYPTMFGYTEQISGAAKDGSDYLSKTLNYNRYVSFYGNASYTYDERYGVSASARSDASNLIVSKPKYRWSPLWSVGVIYNLHNERYMKPAKWVDRLTFRATYGQNGNACSSVSARTTINTNMSYPDYATGIYYGEISDYGNPTLRWEKTATTNVGLDFSLFGNHLFGSIDYYDKKGTDILGTVTMSSVNGTSSATYNNAEISNRGVEVTLGATANIGEVKLTGTLTYAYNKNKITKLYNEITTVSDLLNTEFVEGYPMSPVFTFRYAGVNEEGMPMIYNGVIGDDGKEGTTTIDDLTIWDTGSPSMVKCMGTRVSPHTAGLSLNAEWRGFSLTALFNGRFGGKMTRPRFYYNNLSSYSKANYTAALHDVLNGASYQLPLPTENIDSYLYDYWGFFSGILDINVEDASYIYCKEVVLNYDFPMFNGASKVVKGLGLFAKVENLGLLWSANDKHYHPEYPIGSQAPTATYTIGARVNF